jgi:hypothetical protein
VLNAARNSGVSRLGNPRLAPAGRSALPVRRRAAATFCAQP